VIVESRAIAIDVGDQDGLRVDAGKLHDILDNYGVANTLEIYFGMHTSAVAADFNNFVVLEPRPCGLTRPIPISRFIALTDRSNGNALTVAEGKVQSAAGTDHATPFRVVDRGHGRIALQTQKGEYVLVSVTG